MPDQTKFRIFNLDSFAITFDIALPTGLVSTALSSGSGTSYTRIVPGSYRLHVHSHNPITPTKSVIIPFNPGRIYTIYIVPSIDPSSSIYNQANIPQVIMVIDGNTCFNKCIWT